MNTNLKRSLLASAAATSLLFAPGAFAQGDTGKTKATANDEKVAPEDRFAARLKLAKLPRNSSKVRVHHRCELSGRPKGYYRKVKLSRIALRSLSNFGQIPGMTKASW